jgi:hypothetical protein
MKQRTLVVLGGAAVLSVASALLLSPSSRVEAVPGAGALAFDGLGARLGSAARIEIGRPGGRLALERRGDAWVAVDTAGYPVRPERVRELLAGLAGMRLVEPRTADPALHGRLGVDDPSKPGGTGILLRVQDGTGAPLAELVVGRVRAAAASAEATPPEGTYVRRPAEARSWLADGRLPIDADPRLWIDRTVVDLPAARVRQAEVRRAGQPELVLAREETLEAKLALAAPAGVAARDETALDEVAHALEAVAFLDVRGDGAKPGEPVGETRFALSDGVSVVATGTRDGDTLWLRLRAEKSGPSGDAEAAGLNARWRGWSYKVSAAKETSLFPRFVDLGAPEPAPRVPVASVASPATDAANSPIQPAAATAQAGSASPSPTAKSTAAPAASLSNAAHAALPASPAAVGPSASPSTPATASPPSSPTAAASAAFPAAPAAAALRASAATPIAAARAASPSTPAAAANAGSPSIPSAAALAAPPAGKAPAAPSGPSRGPNAGPTAGSVALTPATTASAAATPASPSPGATSTTAIAAPVSPSPPQVPSASSSPAASAAATPTSASSPGPAAAPNTTAATPAAAAIPAAEAQAAPSVAASPVPAAPASPTAPTSPTALAAPPVGFSDSSAAAAGAQAAGPAHAAGAVSAARGPLGTPIRPSSDAPPQAAAVLPEALPPEAPGAAVSAGPTAASVAAPAASPALIPAAAVRPAVPNAAAAEPAPVADRGTGRSRANPARESSPPAASAQPR